MFGAVRADSPVSLGPFRLPADFFQTIVRLYPEDSLFAAASSQVS